MNALQQLIAEIDLDDQSEGDALDWAGLQSWDETEDLPFNQEQDNDQEAEDDALDWAAEQDWEDSQVDLDEEASYLRDLESLIEFDSAKHPRNKKGQFTYKYKGPESTTLSKIDTSNWKNHSAANWAKKKIVTLEGLANEGKYAQMEQAFYIPAGGKSKLNTYQQAVLVAQDNLKALNAQKVAAAIAEAPKQIESAWKQVGPKLGTENGGQFIGPDGQKYYVKIPENAQRAHNEVLALKLYELAGVPTVDGGITHVHGKTAVATKWMDDAQKADWDNASIKTQAQQHFAAHAWLANWDVIGAGSENPMDNIKLAGKSNTLKVVDAGGALEFSGMGGSGKKAFTEHAGEWNTLRDPSINPSAAKVFAGMTANQLEASTYALKSITAAHITSVVDAYHYGTAAEKTALAAKLVKRKDQLISEGEAIKAYATNKAKSPEMGGLFKELAADLDADIAKTAPVPKYMPASIPPPPVIATKSYASYQKTVNNIHALAAKGDIAGVEAIKTNPDSKAHYIKKTHQYKQDVLAALGQGATVNPDHIAKPTPPPKQTAAPTAPSMVPLPADKAPPLPEFKSGNTGPANTAIASALLKVAVETGDYEAIKASKLPPSPKLQQFQAELLTKLKANNPELRATLPAGPPKVAGVEITALAAKLPVKPSAGADKVGYWSQIAQIPEPIQPANKLKWGENASDIHEKLGPAAHSKLTKSERSTLTSYTSAGYAVANDELRDGKTTGFGGEVARAVIKGMHDLPEGTILGRKYDSFDSHDALKPGVIVADAATLSTSTNRATWNSKSHHWNIVAGPGAKGLSVKEISDFKSESEVMLPPNSRMMITKVTKGSGKVIIDAILLPFDPAQWP